MNARENAVRRAETAVPGGNAPHPYQSRGLSAIALALVYVGDAIFTVARELNQARKEAGVPQSGPAR